VAALRNYANAQTGEATFPDIGIGKATGPSVIVRY
jgi:hypothetical protein